VFRQVPQMAFRPQWRALIPALIPALSAWVGRLASRGGYARPPVLPALSRWAHGWPLRVRQWTMPSRPPPLPHPERLAPQALESRSLGRLMRQLGWRPPQVG
jgi:hypothetical protein